MNRTALPVDSLIPEILESLRKNPILILQASAGAGKTTRVPPAILEIVKRQVLVLEPRRLAARLSAERVAFELGETCGETVGYHIRYEQSGSARTRLKFITEGILLRFLMQDAALRDVDCIVLDEFHERHIFTDVALALVRHLQNTVRPDLKLVIMSATLDTVALASYLPEARVLQSATRAFPIEIEYLPKPDPRPLELLVRAAILQALAKADSGHILVFLPGAAEIRRAAEAIDDVVKQHNCLLLELRAETPPAEQKLVFASSSQRKIILSTNVAETSVTVDGVTAVVDSGLAKIPGYDPWSGIPQLETRPISQSSATQRSGRAGRTAPGVALRLYTKHDYSQRPAADKPEIQRLDLTQILLDLELIAEQLPGHSFRSESLLWLDPPPANRIEGCRELLKLLQALDEQGNVTATGREMSGFALHPRLSRMIVEGKHLHIQPQAMLAAALLSEGTITRRGADAEAVAQNDVSFQMELLRKSPGVGIRRQEQIDAASARRVEQLARRLGESGRIHFSEMLKPAGEESLALALLSGFPDRVAQVRSRTRDRIELALCGGGTALLSRSSTVRDSEFLIALESEETRGAREASTRTQIRLACGIESETLLAGPPELLREEETHAWDNAAERVRSMRRLRYGTLVLEEKSIPGSSEEVESALRSAVRERWPKPFENAGAVESLQLRAALLREQGIAVDVPDLNGSEFDVLLRHICSGRKSFAEIRRHSLEEYLQDLIPGREMRVLRENTPESITLRSGRQVRVHYEAGKTPWIASALQDFIGVRETPAIAGGRIRLVVHLLAPNRRPVQITQDLESFWKNQYPELRQALSRRYPKHKWPE